MEAKFLCWVKVYPEQIVPPLHSILELLPQNDKERKEKYQELLGQINSLNEQLQHLIKIENPQIVTDLAPFDPSISIETMLIDENTIYVTTANSNELYKITIGDEEKHEKLELSDNDYNLNLVLKNKDTIKTWYSIKYCNI